MTNNQRSGPNIYRFLSTMYLKIQIADEKKKIILIILTLLSATLL